MAFDLKTALLQIAPTLATMLLGPLAGGAVTALEGALGLQQGAGKAAVASALQQGALTPEIIAAIRGADQAHEQNLKSLNIDLAKVNADYQKAMAEIEVDDRKDARKNLSGHSAIWWIGSLILVTFAIVMSMVLYGSWYILQRGIEIKDVGAVAAISGLIGSVVGYVAANAQTVINFMFGGSFGSDKKTDAMNEAIRSIGRHPSNAQKEI